MLVVTRKEREVVFLLVGKPGEKLEGEIKITLTLGKIKNGRAKLGFEAPQDKVKIWRKEVYDAILRGEKRKKF